MANVYEIEVDGHLVCDVNENRPWRCYNVVEAEREAAVWVSLGSKSVVVIGPPTYGDAGRRTFACSKEVKNG
jgi:hypothetical protein